MQEILILTKSLQSAYAKRQSAGADLSEDILATNSNIDNGITIWEMMEFL